jgi:hypothetical protein
LNISVNWVLDDEPVILKTTHGTVVALPYDFELHDRHDGSSASSVRDDVPARTGPFRVSLRGVSRARKIMAIACHPYLSGVPHRIGHVQRTFEEILSRDGVVA